MTDKEKAVREANPGDLETSITHPHLTPTAQKIGSQDQPTADQFRRRIRAELQIARARDGAFGKVRMWHDARELDRRMVEAGFEPGRTTWGTDPVVVATKNARRVVKSGGGLHNLRSSDG